MENKLEKPGIYHYLFSRLPKRKTNESVARIAESIASPLIEKHRLNIDYGLEASFHDVKPLRFIGNDESETYLLQFWLNDILTTELVFNRTDSAENPVTFWLRALKPNFACSDDHLRFGEMSVLFAGGDDGLAVVREIVKGCWQQNYSGHIPFCRFEWGRLYFLTELSHYVLLIPEAKDLALGNQFLSTDWPLLEAIRQKLCYQEKQSEILRDQILDYEYKIDVLFEETASQLDRIVSDVDMSERLNDMKKLQFKFNECLFNTEALMHTLTINIENMQNFAASLSLKENNLLQTTVSHFDFVRQQIDYDLKYSKLMLAKINKQQEFFHLKIELKRQQIEEKSNELSKFCNALIFSLGVALGVGQTLIQVDWDWSLKLLIMAFCFCVTFINGRLVGIEKLTAFLRSAVWSKRIG